MQKKTDDKYAEFNKLLQESQMILVKVCMQFTDRQPDSIKDLYQEIAINLWESMPSFRGDSSQTTWVYRIAINTAYMELRKRARQNLFVDLDQQMLESLAEEAQDERTTSSTACPSMSAPFSTFIWMTYPSVRLPISWVGQRRPSGRKFTVLKIK